MPGQEAARLAVHAVLAQAFQVHPVASLHVQRCDVGAIDEQHAALAEHAAVAVVHGGEVALAEGSGAKLAEYEAMVAELTETVARLKSHNYDLLMQVSATPYETPDDTPDDAAEESGGVDDLFTSEDD